MTKNSIKQLNAVKQQLLETYHKDVLAIDMQIEAIRAQRGTQLKQPDMTNYVETGRDKQITNGNW